MHLMVDLSTYWKGSRVYVAQFQATFATPDDTQVTMTTEVNIIPNTFPFERCEGPDECRGTLV